MLQHGGLKPNKNTITHLTYLKNQAYYEWKMGSKLSCCIYCTAYKTMFSVKMNCGYDTDGIISEGLCIMG